MEETWKNLSMVGGIYSEYYAVSNLGRVKSLRKNRILKNILPNKKRSYTEVHLNRYGRVRVHRIVAHEFLGPCPKGYVVNHKNGIKTDNNASNLEYVTEKQNIQHATDLGLRRGISSEKRAQIVSLLKSGLTGYRIAKKLNLTHQSVYYILRRIGGKGPRKIHKINSRRRDL